MVLVNSFIVIIEYSVVWSLWEDFDLDIRLDCQILTKWLPNNFRTEVSKLSRANLK